MTDRQDRLKGFSAPLSPDGKTASFGPPPWRFFGRSLTVVAECNAQGAAALVPTPLRPVDGPARVRFSVHRLTCDLGFGRHFAQTNPERCQFHEAVVGLTVEHEGLAGFWDPFLWCDGEAEIAVGREMYGWPQREASLSLTEPHPQAGWRIGDQVVGKVSRFHDPVMTLCLTIDRDGDLDVDLPTFSTFFTERALPDPATGQVTRELFASTMADVVIGDLHAGEAELAVHAPELQGLRPLRVLGGRVNTIAWTKDRARRIASRSVDAEGRSISP